MKRLQSIIMMVLISSICISSPALAGERHSNKSVELVATKNTQNKLYTVDATGEYDGYKILKGHAKEKEFDVYFKGEPDSYSYFTKQLKKVNLNEVITWKFDNYTFKNTRLELYNFFADTGELSTLIGDRNTMFSQEWLRNTFGKVYSDWIDRNSYLDEAERLVREYFIQTGSITIDDTPILTPDFIFVEEQKSFVDYGGTIGFRAYDDSGKLIGEFYDSDDSNQILAMLEDYKELPPRLSDGWINSDLLSKIYGFQINEKNNEIIFEKNISNGNKKEVLRLKLPKDWKTSDQLTSKVDDVGLKKYVMEKRTVEGEWIDQQSLYEMHDILVTMGDTLDDFRFTGPHDMELGYRKEIYSGKWPSRWERNKDQNEVNLNGLRVMRKNHMNCFHIETLQKMNIMPKPKREFVTYMNILDLQKIGLIK